jgi:glutathione S-transferase
LPFIEIDGAILFESGAIMLYLAERFRDQADLLPTTTSAHYPSVLQWLFFAVSTLEASSEELESGAEPQPFTPAVDTFAFLEKELSHREFIAADRFTIADIALATGLKWFDRKTIAKFPNLKRYFELHTQRAAYLKIAGQPEHPKL